MDPYKAPEAPPDPPSTTNHDLPSPSTAHQQAPEAAHHTEPSSTQIPLHQAPIPPAAPSQLRTTPGPEVQKVSHHCTTPDGWRLHLIHTTCPEAARHNHRIHPVVLVPGLGSSGAYTFDLAPAVSLSDYLACQGWDVWTVELRGNGLSDKPLPFKRSRWWTVDDYVAQDLPALLRYIQHTTRAPALHVLGHSMGGMILCGVLGRDRATAALIRSATVVGSGCFLEESWWRVLRPVLPLSHLLYTVPAGAAISLASRVAFTKCAIPALDMLYFWPSNTRARLARALLTRNFSAISPGVILQFSTSFDPAGLLTADKKLRYADEKLLAAVEQPVLFMVGDRDRMCPAPGAKKTFEMFTGNPSNKYICFGPESGHKDHYGHFDILMGKRVEEEVFPVLLQWLEQHDAPRIQANL